MSSAVEIGDTGVTPTASGEINSGSPSIHSKDPSEVDILDPTAASMDSVDFVLVWSGKEQGSKSQKSVKRRKIFESHLEKEGLILSREVLSSKDLHFIKIFAPLEVLQRYAEILRLQMPIKEIPGIVELRKQSFIEMLTAKSISKLQICFGISEEIFPKPEPKITAAYNKEKQYLFDIDDTNFYTYFTPALRSRIVHFILKRKRYSDDDKDALAFGFERLIKSNAYTAAYPLHDGDFLSTSRACQRGLLYRYWASFRNVLNYQPLDTIKTYFGVKIGIYFAWLGFYTWMLTIPAILGVICFMYGGISLADDPYTNAICRTDKTKPEIVMCPLCDSVCEFQKLSKRCDESRVAELFDNDSTAIFAFIMSIWTVVFLEFWKRYSAELNHRWHLNNFTERDQAPRPEYIAKLKNSTTKKFNYITNTIEPAIPFWKIKLPYTVLSLSGMLGLIGIATAASVGVIVYRISTLVAFSSFQHALLLVTFTSALINLAFIFIFSIMYERIAKYLTDFEIPRTNAEYESSYAFKLYALEFINHYASLFYIAYFKGRFVGAPNKYIKLFGKWRQEECGISCMPELCIQLSVIMIGKQAKNALLEMIIPYFKKLIKNRKLKKTSLEKVEIFKKQIIADYELLDWKPESLTEEYLEMAIQYGFVTIFVAAFPLAPLFALLNNVFELRSDAQKFVKHYKRSVAIRVKGIGVWYSIMDSVAKFAVLSNAFIIAITSNFVPKIVYRYFLLEQEDPRYGTLDGFLDHSLSKFAVADMNPPPNNITGKIIPTVCSFPAQRHGFDHPEKYEFTDEHWKIWLGRVIFVIAFENIVATCFFFIRWAIPDSSEELQKEIQREDYLTSELIIQQELLRARGVLSEMHGFIRVSSDKRDAPKESEMSIRRREGDV